MTSHVRTNADHPYRLLLPRPRRIIPAGGSATKLQIDQTPAFVRDLRPQPGGYSLSIGASGVSITAGDEAGARHANATLTQIRRFNGNEFPAAVIEDEPALSKRGVMLDVSRCRVPQMREFACVIETFASLKINHLQCYTEHAFAYRAHPAVWEGTDPITPSEARSLDGLCSRHGIDLAANQNCFGHLTRWLERPEYAPLAETHGDWIFAGMPRSGPFSLCPTDPRSLRFVEGLLNELLPCFRSDLVNIGCDETYDVGQGRAAQYVQELGKARVYGKFVGSICEAVLARGKTPMFWADIATDHPRALDHIPTEAHALVWGYEPGHEFAAQGARHHERGRPWWVCPGTSSWQGFSGRAAERHANIREASSAGVAGGATGMLITDWGDLGHRQVWPIALLAITEGADAAWTGTPRTDDFLDAASLQVFGDSSGKVARWIEEFGDADEPIRAVAGPLGDGSTPSRLVNASAIFTELHPPPLKLALPENPGPWRSCRDRLVDLARRVPTGGGPLIEAELRHALACSVWACDVAITRRGVAIDVGSLRVQRDAIKREQSRLWRLRSRAGGLDESVGFWDGIALESGS